MMKLGSWMAASLLLLSGAVSASVTVNGNMISWPDDGWYQVQGAENFVTFCDGTDGCTVPDGTYIVINHTTGERWEQVQVPETEDAEDMTGDPVEDTDEDAEDSSEDEQVEADADSAQGLTVTDSSISWPDDGWYQVQSAADFSTLCEGGLSCETPPGTYIVINHSTGMRWDDVVVAASGDDSTEEMQESGDASPDTDGTDDDVPDSTSDALTISDNLLQWEDDGWYQVQDATTFSTVCEGGTSCEVPAGTFIVINLTTGQRWENIVVSGDQGSGMQGDDTPVADDPDTSDAGEGDSDADSDTNSPDDSVSSEPQVNGTVISWSDDGWYQVQSQETFQTLCEGGTSCDVAVAGSYIVINLTTGQRWQDIVVGSAGEVDSGSDDADQMVSGDDGQNNEDPDTAPTSPSEPDGDSEQLELQIDGLLISWADDGWYQVQSATTFETVCEGGSSCLVPARGLYNVINHSTGMRWIELAVFDTTGVWFGQSSFGDAVFVIDADGDLFGLSSNGIDTHESVFGNLGSDLPALRFLHSGSQNPLHGNAFLFSGERPTFTNPNELDSVVFDFSVTNEGQQLDNASVAGNFSLSYANTDDVAAISVADISGSWASRSSFCSSGCDLTLVMSFTGDGFVQGATFFNGANELGLAGSVSAAAESTQYLNISFIWNGVRKTGVLYYDRNSNALVLNTIGDDSEIGQRSFSTLLVKQ